MPGMNESTFTLKAEHIKLLTHAYVRWDDAETGAPAIDPKRPYGNSSVAYDIAELFGVDLDGDRELPSMTKEELLKWHYETEIALQVILDSQSFRPGKYVKIGYGRWQRCGCIGKLEAL